MRDVTLAARVKLLVGVLLAVLAVSAALAWATVAERDEAIAVLDERIEPARDAVNELLAAVVDQETGVRAYLLTGDDALLETYAQGRVAEHQALERLEDVLEPEPELLRLAADVAAAADEWHATTIEPELAAAETGDAPARPSPAASGAERVAFDEFRQTTEHLREELKARQVEARERFDGARHRVTLVLAANILVGTGIALTAAVLVTRWVTTPLSTVAAAAREVASGALAHPIPAVGPPELAGLGSDTERMRRRMVAELEDAVRAREALAHSGPLVALLREELEPSRPKLPESLELATRFLPASGVLAGDWFDVFLRDDGRLVVALVDVSGHGPSAGVFALRAKQMVAAALTEDRAPGEALDWVARHLGDTGDAFLTGALVEIDPATGVCRYANAGHPPALLVTGDRVEPLGPTGPLLGPLPGAWDTAQTQLGPGDLLLLHTDAVVESRDPDGDEFGPQRLAHILARHRADGPEAAVEACLDEVRRFSDADLADDLTLVALGWRPAI